MSESKRPVWLFVAVVLGLAIVAYLALRPQPSVLPTPAAARPTAVAQVVPLAAFGFEQTPVFASHTPATWHWSDAEHVTASHGCAIRHTLISWIDQ